MRPRPLLRRVPGSSRQSIQARLGKRALVIACALAAAVLVVAPPAGAATLSFAPTADTTVEQSAPDTNYGSASELRADNGGDPMAHGYLKFTVTGVSGAVQSAKLRVYATISTSNGPYVVTTSTSWTESGLTWNSRPGATSSVTDDKGAIAAGTWVEYDVTSLVTGNGTYSLRLTTGSSSDSKFSSREGSNRPQLVVTDGSSGVSDSAAPTVSLTSPAGGSTVSGTTSVSASASDDIGVTRVDFSVDGSPKASDASSPWGFSLDTTSLSNAAHTISAQAFDASGKSSAASSISVTVSNAAAAPSPPPPTSSGACKWYVSPSGSSSNTGKSTSSPLTLDAVISKTSAGDVVCLMAGTYNRSASIYPKSGSAGKVVVYRSYGGTATLKWTGGTVNAPVIGFANGRSYIEVNGLTIDGGNKTAAAVNCNTAHHVRVIGNRLQNGGAAGFSSYQCDYMTVDRNLIHHNGYAAGWSSGISLNTSKWNDSYTGFHSYVTNNVVSGSYDNYSTQTDGNGIIMDRGGAVPPVLVANNVVYENYFRCIHSYHLQNIWVVNNTCYKNVLRVNPSNNTGGEITLYDAQNVHLINNVVYGWTTTYPYKVESGSGGTFERNVGWGGGRASLVPSSVSGDPNQLRTADPMFVSPPSVDPNATGQWAGAVAPWAIGDAFRLQSGSSLIDAGIDPRNAQGLNAELRNGISSVLGKDASGAARPQGGGFDVGAYER